MAKNVGGKLEGVKMKVVHNMVVGGMFLLASKLNAVLPLKSLLRKYVC